jgi:uncharacterized protein YodC (DUF2158 family)
MTNAEFDKGDIVRLTVLKKSPQMIVEEILTVGVKCFWFDNNNAAQSYIFDQNYLEKISSRSFFG